MDQGGRLQGLSRLLGRQPGGGELAQLVVNEWEQIRGGVRIASLDRRKDARDLIHRPHDSGLYEESCHSTRLRSRRGDERCQGFFFSSFGSPGLASGGPALGREISALSNSPRAVSSSFPAFVLSNSSNTF